MKNIFENAYFGKPYKTRDGRKAVLITFNQRNKCSPYVCAVSCYFDMSIKSVCHNFYPDGKLHENSETVYDIVSEWTEETNEKELDELAYRWAYNISGTYVRWELLQDAYKAGYRKAKNNDEQLVEVNNQSTFLDEVDMIEMESMGIGYRTEDGGFEYL